MKNAIATIAIICCFLFSANAQKTATWKGGAAGKSNDWSCAANWKEGRVPDEFCDVVIPNVSSTGNFQPVIRAEVDAVHSLRILPGATLRITAQGALEVSEPLEGIAANSLQNQGRLDAIMPGNPAKAETSAIASNR